MILEIFVKMPLTPFILFMTENNFLHIFNNPAGLRTVNETTHWLNTESDALKEKLSSNGALLFRGFPIQSAQDFDVFSSAFNYVNFTYQESLSNAVRINKTPKVFTANEAPPEVEIFLHHEMAQTPIHPDKIFFCCLSISEQGGATPLCRSDKVYQALKEEHSEYLAKFEAHGLKYTTLMPEADELTSGQGRGWRSTLSVNDKNEAEEKLKELDYNWEWQENGSLQTTTPALPATIELSDGSISFFNQIIAAHRGWKIKEGTSAPAVTFGNGESIDGDLLNAITEIAERFTLPLEWETGDIALIDNKRIMHGRHPYSGEKKREVVVSFAKD